MELSLQLSNCISSITTDALLIYIFCTSCEPENVLTFQEIKKLIGVQSNHGVEYFGGPASPTH